MHNTALVLDQKRAAAAAAAALVQSGMCVGLGSGSTALLFVSALAQRVRDEGLLVRTVATSRATEAAAVAAGLGATLCRDNDAACGGSFGDWPPIDLAVDGADECDPHGRMIKGGGGALLREKIILQAATRRVIIIDASKQVAVLGAFPLPVEVFAYGMAYTRRVLEALDIEPVLRPTLSDNGNPIFDLPLMRIEQPEDLAHELSSLAGVAAHGLFLSHADVIFCGSARVYTSKSII